MRDGKHPEQVQQLLLPWATHVHCNILTVNGTALVTMGWRLPNKEHKWPVKSIH
jgi:hypothetical protein